MKIMNCPLNGPRNIQEFVCAGTVQEHPEPNRCSDEEWTDFVFMEENRAGVVREWWCHVATAYWFIAERDTVADEIVTTYPASTVFTERVAFHPPEPPPEPVQPVAEPPQAAQPETAPPASPDAAADELAGAAVAEAGRNAPASPDETAPAVASEAEPERTDTESATPTEDATPPKKPEGEA